MRLMPRMKFKRLAIAFLLMLTLAAFYFAGKLDFLLFPAHRYRPILDGPDGQRVMLRVPDRNRDSNLGNGPPAKDRVDDTAPEITAALPRDSDDAGDGKVEDKDDGENYLMDKLARQQKLIDLQRNMLQQLQEKLQGQQILQEQQPQPQEQVRQAVLPPFPLQGKREQGQEPPQLVAKQDDVDGQPMEEQHDDSVILNRPIPLAANGVQQRVAPVPNRARPRERYDALRNNQPVEGKQDAFRMFQQAVLRNKGVEDVDQAVDPQADLRQQASFRQDNIPGVDAAKLFEQAVQRNANMGFAKNVPQNAHLQAPRNALGNNGVVPFGFGPQAVRDPVEAVEVVTMDLAKPLLGMFRCIPMRLSPSPRNVCVYPFHTDQGVSKRISETGTWEEAQLTQFLAALATSTSLGVLDLGAGLGVYTLAAALRGHPVLAVEPLKDNYRLFIKTMQVNLITDKVSLVTDALGERVGEGFLRSPHPSGNMGAVYVERIDPAQGRHVIVGDTVRIIRLDDLIPLVTFPSVVIKLDVQGDESKVLKGGSRFFAELDVRYVFMHWLAHQNTAQYKECEMFLKLHGFEPVVTVTGGEAYTDAQLNDDLNFVVWRKT